MSVTGAMQANFYSTTAGWLVETSLSTEWDRNRFSLRERIHHLHFELDQN
jgi:hypothetical protein